MSDIAETALQEGPSSIPMRRNRAAPVVQEHDAETGLRPLPPNLPSWLIAATDASPALIASLADTPAAVAGVLTAASDQARDAQTRMITRRHQGALSNFLRGTTTYTDVTNSPEFRALLRNLNLPQNPNEDDHRRLLDTVRDSFVALRQKIDELPLPPDGNQADHDFLKRKISGEIDALIRSTGTTAYRSTGPTPDGEAGPAQWKRVVTTAATLAIGASPFAYAVLTNPTSWFYLVGLAGAYTRTAQIAAGMAMSGSLTWNAIWQHVNERQVVWALPSVFYAGQYAVTYGDDHPESKGAVAGGHLAKTIIEHPAFLSTVAVVEFAIFAAANHPDKVAALWRKLTPGSQSSRLARGEITAGIDDETAEDIRKYFKAGSKLIGVMGQIGDQWVSEGERLSDTERLAMRAMRVDLAQLGGTLETLVGGIADPGGEDDEAENQDQRSLGRRILEAPVDGVKALANLPQTIRDMPPERRQKFAVGLTLSVLAAVLGAISSLAAIRVPALLTDYIPYYATSVILLLLQTTDQASTASDVARTFGSYFGGTIIGIIPSIMNLIFLFATKEGFFDIVANNSTQALPANATFTPGHPSMALTNHPNIHGADGRINFGVGVAYTMIAIMLVGGRLGDDIAKKIIAGLGAATTDDADSQREDEAREDEARDDEEREDEEREDEEREDEEREDEEREDEEREGEEREDEQRRSAEGRRAEDESHLPSDEVGLRRPSQEAGDDSLQDLRKLAKGVSRDDVAKITKGADAFAKAKDIALDLRPEGLKFDPENPPPGTPDEDIAEATALAAEWADSLKAALSAISGNEAGPSRQ